MQAEEAGERLRRLSRKKTAALQQWPPVCAVLSWLYAYCTSVQTLVQFNRVKTSATAFNALLKFSGLERCTARHQC